MSKSAARSSREDAMWSNIELLLAKRIERIEQILLDANFRGDLSNNKQLQELWSERRARKANAKP
jgi:hypothetical protein